MGKKEEWDEIFAAVHGMSFDKLPRKNKDCDGDSAKECTALRNKIKKQFSKLCGLVRQRNRIWTKRLKTGGPLWRRYAA